jgi:hypothetical protein
MLFEIGLRMEHRSGFKKSHVEAEVNQDLSSRTSARAGADNNDVGDRGAALDLEHTAIISPARYRVRRRRRYNAAQPANAVPDRTKFPGSGAELSGVIVPVV